MSESHAPPGSSAPQPAESAGSSVLAFPASPAQEAFFYLEKLNPAHPAFNVPVRFELTGVLDRRLLKAAFDALAERHEGLRTRFVEEDGKLLQLIEPVTTFPLPVTDISHLSGRELEDELNRLGSIEARAPFDMGQDPLFRASLIVAAPDRHILQITIHHSVADGWSIGIMTDELAELYNAALENRPHRLEPLAIQYVDFTIWQREFLASPALTPHLDYWKEKLRGYTELELPADRPRPAVKSWDGDIVSLVLRPSTSEKVARVSRQKGATMYHVFLAAFKALAQRYTGLDDIAVGSPVAGRSRAELEPIIGTFINSVILRTDLAGDPTFGDLVGRVRETVTDALAHQELPFEQLVQALQPRRDAGRNPLFQINVTHQRDFVKPVNFGGARLAAIPSRSPGAIFDLHFFMVERADGWRISCDFARDLFDRATAERLLRHFETFIDAAAGQPELPLSQLPLLTPGESDQFAAWSAHPRPYPSDRSLGELFLEQAARTPDRVALTHGDRPISYQLLAAAALGLRGRLDRAGVKPGDRVALCAPSIPEMIAAQIGILLAGAACVPLDPGYPADRLRFMLEDCGATAILTTAALAEKLPDATRTLLLTPLAESLVMPVLAKISFPAESVSHVFYTSGSTGTPKGVQVTHRGISRLTLGGDFMDFTADDSFLQAAPVSFDAATLEIWMPLLNGGRIVLTGEGGPSLPAIARAIREQGVTCLWLTAGLFQTMVDEHLADLRGLRFLLAGGDVLSPTHVSKAFDALPDTVLINGYGPTENTTFTCCHRIQREDLDRPSIPIGRPIGNTTVHVLDAQLRPVPVGISGDLHTGGDGLALGYLGNDALTAEKFHAHPEFGRLYRTGDRARWLADGTLEFLGRTDGQAKVRGFRIETGEIESHLSSHPDVRQAKVAVRGDSAESRRILAWIVAVPGTAPTPAALADHLAAFLPRYMRPDGIGIVESLPLSANGKVDVSALQDPSHAADSPSEICNAPEGLTEIRLAAIWSELLGLAEIGRDDNFFALGGHSLMAMRLFSRINREFNQTLPLATLISHPTLRQLAPLVAPEPEPELPSKGHFVTLAKGGAATPLFCIHGGDGGVLFYRDLAARMPTDLPLHAIESLELGSSGEILPASIEETATAYLRILLARQSHGPFRLAGYSYGGVVAHEMARQLVAKGHRVEFLGLFDTHNVAADGRKFTLIERLGVFWKQNSNVPFLSRLNRVRNRFFEGIATRRRIQEEVTQARSSGPAEPYSDLRRVQVREENWRAMLAYVPGPLKARVTLFKSTTESDKVLRRADYGWGDLAEDGLDLVNVPGEHLTLFAPEHVDHLATALTAALATTRS
ncbi:MAG: amino acid adenylation domain-containing protein [Verrucomicrobiota bacterium]